ncbi:MAG: P-II family nitrogen regulator [Deltaproteobacteria bacterium]|jgi:nitrogen regulatory protein PII|nr:P-II family nitrogen regulator [Deltaproteobacteria bacterium]
MNEILTVSSYLPGDLVISIVPRGQGEKIMRAVRRAGARGGTILEGRGSVNNKLARILGLDSRAVELVFTLVDSGILEAVFEALATDEDILKLPEGAAMHLNARGILRREILPPGARAETPETDIFSVNPQAGRSAMSQAKYELITVIANTGFSEEIMEAARGAGAPGGTIMNAKGTGRAEDVKFFGITIVPEKEFIILVVPKNKTKAVLKAIQDLPSMSQAGVGIIYCLDVTRFVQLGKKMQREFVR